MVEWPNPGDPQGAGVPRGGGGGCGATPSLPPSHPGAAQRLDTVLSKSVLPTMLQNNIRQEVMSIHWQALFNSTLAPLQLARVSQ